jgi:probable rRNA maturation factor
LSVTCRLAGVGHPLRSISNDARRLLRAAGVADRELSIVLCSDPFIRELNRAWRGKDVSTDVLSFAGAAPVLGDVIISLDTARRQARELGHALDRELRVLLVHGICHLRGFDHESPAEASAMGAEERRLLAGLARTAEGLVLRSQNWK